MKNSILLLLTTGLLLTTLLLNSQTRISGFIKDGSSGERLIGANVIESGTIKGTVTDNNGYFTLFAKVPIELQFSFIGYTTLRIPFYTINDTLLEINLLPGKDLAEVVVQAENRIIPNIAKLTTIELQSLPSISGKPDVMKAVQLLPGIQSQSEGSSLLLVRGGSPGENMYLFDNVSVIYVNHLGGFMSVFNPDIINSIDIYKGGFPSRYGGKLSSVVDITQKEGNTSGFKGSYSIGITDVSFTLEGPIKKNLSYIFTGRKTLFGLLMMAASGLSEGNTSITAYGFHDVNGKISWRPNTKNSVHFNVYQGDDYLNYWAKQSKEIPANKNRLSYVWGNWLVATDWKHIVSRKLFTENNFSYSRYRLRERQEYSFEGENGLESINYEYLSSVQVISYLSAWKYQLLQKYAIDFGLKSSLAFNLPNYTYQSNILSTTDINRIPTLETALYCDNKIILPFHLQLNAGIRLVNFNTEGYTDFALEPRLSLNKEIANNHQINLSYMRVTQFSHLLYTPGSIMSNEVWIPADNIIKPSYSDQLSMSWIGKFGEGKYQSDICLYYKTLNNLATYKEGYVNLKGDANWHSKVETAGKGKSYGVEVYVRKNTGNWTGFISYAWSKTTRQFPSINNAETYLYEFNRPNTASIVVNHKFNKRLILNMAWVYQTGLPYSPVIARQLTPSLEPNSDGEYIYYETFIYGKRNSARLKDYHRLDVSLTLNNLTDDDKIKSSWSFGLYNAYNRKNPVYYYYNTNSSAEIINPETSGEQYKPFMKYQLSLFPIIPTISYKFYFDSNDLSKSTMKKRFNNWLYHEK